MSAPDTEVHAPAFAAGLMLLGALAPQAYLVMEVISGFTGHV
jgi:hypothetical protein